MSTSPEPDFIQIRRLLSLKRHEQPPPGYFDFLAGRVQEALRSAQMARLPVVEPVGRLSALAVFLERLQARPSFAVGLGGVICALLVGFVILSESTDPAAQPMTGSLLAEGMMLGPSGLAGNMAVDPLAAPINPFSESNPPAGGSLFDLIQPLPTMPAGVNR